MVRTIDGRIVTGAVESETDDVITLVYVNDRFVIPLKADGREL